MTPWSYKRRKWNHDVEAHRHYLLTMWFTKLVAKELARKLDEAILYGERNARLGGDSFTCTVSVSNEILKLITGVDYAEHNG